MVFSSVIAAWSDVSNLIPVSTEHGESVLGHGLGSVTEVVHKLNVGYFWMLVNCLTSAGYVCPLPLLLLSCFLLYVA